MSKDGKEGKDGRDDRDRRDTHDGGEQKEGKGNKPGKMSKHGAMLRGENPPSSRYYDQGRFGRMFPALEPFAADTPTLRAALMEIGKKAASLMRRTIPTLHPGT